MRSTNHLFCFLEIFSSEGGIQSYIQDILKAYLSLTAANNLPPQAEILLLRDGPDCHNPFESKNLKFSYLKTDPAWLGRFKFATKLLTCLVQKRPQRVFCGHIKLAPLIQTLCQPLGIPYTILTYGKEVWETLPLKYQIAMRQADRIWTISRYTRDRTCELNNLNPEKFQIVPCTVDEKLFTIGPKPLHLLEKYDLTGAKILMTVARLRSTDSYKGVDVTIQALPEIAKSFPNVKYLVIGRGDDRPRLAKLATDLGVAERVIFAGFVPTADLAAHYQLADAYVMPSQEGFGIVYLEALACGIPVLAGDADGSADPLQDGKLGWRVPHRDPAAVAVACVEMLRGKDKKCDRHWLREQTLAAFSFQSLCQSLIGIFQIDRPD
ncbi:MULTISPECIES: glycosyltransferase family 4 protein [unclassified Microcoleus]|uniref:glycosyltransferase family 4 protein n=1 Tax=unclassified Microcoleus TaxID=2642155 RepID=UPI001D916CF0|nr:MULTISPECIES: glycosyltransferase family 4 protein [unclassified Microcoleus]MCC3432325.1 glycosyltransferase family 4 protein [Microcoleus sp. PH2017_04_SCI_O_A]MCC3467075.1 glycosyltransferase family 4 protein [Microcoleus sp. PH2017_06_SFM_O_A]TAF89434.1 MAG: glycosyltransferase family 1 protein [Oscillatoriales cyanobacterium]MCC3411107.1 glycosyltransferase family 4 protein [Microcoleus sp. PH2017_02_FOX_O_A]MCC3437254.1 glycosyltransferase family 4 protein [Microcoleus sp. PH2017_05_C